MPADSTQENAAFSGSESLCASGIRALLAHPIHHRFTATGESITPASDDESSIDFYKHAEAGCAGCAALAALDKAERLIEEIVALMEGTNVPAITTGTNYTASRGKAALRVLRGEAE